MPVKTFAGNPSSGVGQGLSSTIHSFSLATFTVRKTVFNSVSHTNKARTSNGAVNVVSLLVVVNHLLPVP